MNLLQFKTMIAVLACLFGGDAQAKATLDTISTTGKLSAYSFDGVYRHFHMEGIRHFCGLKSHDRAVIKLRDTKDENDQLLRAAYYAGNTVTISARMSVEDFNECKILRVDVYSSRGKINLR